MDQLTCEAVASKIAARLQGKISDAALAQWAETQSYKYELEELELEDEALIDAVLEALTFGDMPGYGLSDEALRSWQQRLQPEE